MDVISVKPRGYCRGVVLAIKKALETKAVHPELDVTILGQLVHNKLVVQALALKGIKTVEEEGLSRELLLERIDKDFVVFSAHGVANAVRDKAQSQGLMPVDATCPEVHFTQNLVDRKIAEGRHVFYVGKAGHPEAVAVCQDKDRVHLITGVNDIPLREQIAAQTQDGTILVFVTNQTTLASSELEYVFERIRERFPEAEFADEICSATRNRQDAIRRHRDLDCLIVVGDPHSNNTAMLARIAQESGITKVIRVESCEELPLEALSGCSRVGVTAGASTPPYLIRQIEDYLHSYDSTLPPSANKPLPRVELEHLLDF